MSLFTQTFMAAEPITSYDGLVIIMGVGMVGIFVVIGAIIVSVAVLNKLTSPKKESNE